MLDQITSKLTVHACDGAALREGTMKKNHEIILTEGRLGRTEAKAQSGPFAEKADAIYERFKAAVTESKSLSNVVLSAGLAASLMAASVSPAEASTVSDVSAGASSSSFFNSPYDEEIKQKADASVAENKITELEVGLSEKKSFLDKASGIYDRFQDATKNDGTVAGAVATVGKGALTRIPAVKNVTGSLAQPIAFLDAAQGKVEPKSAAKSILTTTLVNQVLFGGAAIGSGTVLVAGAAYGVAKLGGWLKDKRDSSRAEREYEASVEEFYSNNSYDDLKAQADIEEQRAFEDSDREGHLSNSDRLESDQGASAFNAFYESEAMVDLVAQVDLEEEAYRISNRGPSL